MLHTKIYFLAILLIITASASGVQVKKRQTNQIYHYNYNNNGGGDTCGTRKVNPYRLTENGYQAMPGEWPWHVAIFKVDNGVYNYLCGATIINDQQIVTAAHCVFDGATGRIYFPSSLILQLGAYDISTVATYTQEISASGIHVHPQYRYPDNNNDIALINLITKANFNNYVQAACLWMDDLNCLAEKYLLNGTTLGWGISSKDTSPNILKASSLPIIKLSDCIESNPNLFGNILKDGMFCAGFQNGATICNGDHGGGLFISQQNSWYLAGIVLQNSLTHWGDSYCTSKDYTVFLNIALYKQWIESLKPNNFNSFFPQAQNTPFSQSPFYNPLQSFFNNQASQFPIQPPFTSTNLNNQPNINIHLNVHLTVQPDSSAKNGYKVIVSDMKPIPETEAAIPETVKPPKSVATSITTPTQAPPKIVPATEEPPTITDSENLLDIINQLQRPLRTYEKKCQEYIEKGFATLDGKRTYIRLYSNSDPISDGRFISENFVLFPAHEIANSNPTHVEKTRGKKTQRYNVAEVIFHPDYVEGKWYNDFALVRLSENVPFSSDTRVFCLYSDNIIPEDQLVVDGDKVRILGKDECQSKLDSKVLKQELSNGITENLICISMCQTRKLAIKDPKEKVSNLVGFLTYCTEESSGTGVYTKIAPYIDWIENIVWLKPPGSNSLPDRRMQGRETMPVPIPPTNPSKNIPTRIWEQKCQEYTEKGFATADGRRTYIRLYRNTEAISDGRFISENFLLFPAHEIVNSMPTHVEKTKGKRTQRYNVAEVIVHPDYVAGKWYNDFALVRLSENVPFSSDTKVFCLYSDNIIPEQYLVVDGDKVRVLGRDECQSKLDPSVLMQELPNGITEELLCISMCQTRKLAIKDPDEKISNLIGFLTYCTEESKGTGVYTKIAPYIDWIEKTVWSSPNSNTPPIPKPSQELDIIPIPSSQSNENSVVPSGSTKNFPIGIWEKKCQEYTEKEFATTDGRRTYIRLFRDQNPISDGRFISENFVLFPAHEIINSNPTHVEKTKGKKMQRYNVSEVIVHPNFVLGKLYDDFALVRLSESVPFNSETRVFCLYSDNVIPQNELVVDGDQVRILSKQECQTRLDPSILKQELPDGVSDNQICISMCQTRKLAIKDPSKKISNLVGFLSYCSEESVGTGVYTKVAPYIDWIESVVWGQTNQPLSSTIVSSIQPPINVVNIEEPFMRNNKLRISQRKCQEYSSQGFASTDGRRTYIRLYRNGESISDGRFISETALIFPAHEIFGTQPTHVEKMKGKVRTRYNVSSIEFHPKYENGLLYNDLAIVRLSEPAKFGTELKVFCLYGERQFNGDYLAGDGDQLKVLNKNDCETKLDTGILKLELPYGVTDTQVCINMCQTRKLAIKDPSQKYSSLVGFLSYCTEESTGTGVYTMVGPNIDWIESVLWPEEASQNFVKRSISTFSDRSFNYYKATAVDAPVVLGENKHFYYYYY